MDNEVIARLCEQHKLTGTFMTSEGWQNNYYDVISAMVHNPHIFRTFFLDRLNGVWPIGAGASGAFILGLLGAGGSLWRAPKGYGLAWHNPPRAGTSVALVDDSAFTGATMNAMRSACEQAGFVVVKEVLALDRRYDRSNRD